MDIRVTTREKALQDGERIAVTKAIDNGAQPETVTILDKSETQLTYFNGKATRIQVKAVGDLALGKSKKVHVESKARDVWRRHRLKLLRFAKLHDQCLCLFKFAELFLGIRMESLQLSSYCLMKHTRFVRKIQCFA